MAIFSPGFTGRRNTDDVKLPPGQYLERGFPVLTAGPTQRIRTDQWEFSIVTETGEQDGLELAGDARPRPREDRHRHPLRHELVEVRHDLEGRLARQSSSTASRPLRTT